MQTMVPLYGFGGGGGTGAALTVNAPAGCTVTVSKDGKTKTKVAGTDGVAVFKGLATGQWTVTISDGEQTAQKAVTITADYSTAITFFAATIHVTYPAGSTCTATDGVTTLTAPDTSGTWACVVPNAGTWTITLDRGYSEKIEVAESSEYTVNKWHLYNSGDQCIDITGGWKSIPTGSGKDWEYNNDCMYYSQGNTGGAGSSTNTIRDIDFSGFNTAYVQFSYNSCMWGISVEINGSVRKNLSDYPAKTVNTANVDVSALSAFPFSIYSASGTIDLKVFNIWLEV